MQTMKSLLPATWPMHVILIVVIVIINIPMYCTIVVSTQTLAETLNNPLLPGTGFLSNLEHAFNRNLGAFILNSILVSLTVALSKTFLSLLAGLAFSFFQFRGKWIAFGTILFTLMIPEELLMIALFRFVSGTLGLGNTFAGVVFPALASAFGTFLFRQHFSSIPTEISEAAQLDGMNPIQYLLYILIPLSWNAIGALFMVVFIGSWNMYMWPLMILANPRKQTIQVGLRMISSVSASAESRQQYGPLMLGAVLASIPLLVMFILMQGQFMSGFSIAQKK
jgi:sn-glycerol 3-phosphate transport system permease protein